LIPSLSHCAIFFKLALARRVSSFNTSSRVMIVEVVARFCKKRMYSKTLTFFDNREPIESDVFLEYPDLIAAVVALPSFLTYASANAFCFGFKKKSLAMKTLIS